MAETELDARGLKCPLPVMRAAKALRGLKPGDLLRVRATDPLAPQDFQDFCAAGGHEMVEAREVAGMFEAVIKVGARPI